MATSRRAASVSSDVSLAELNESPVEQPIQQANQPRQEVALTSKEDHLLTRLIESKQLPGHVRTIADAFTIAKMGRELGFPIMQSFHFIIPIQGKLTLSAKAIGALLRKGGVTMQTTEDAMYVYRDGSTSQYKKAGVGDAPPEVPVDKRTSILFTRDGISELVSFTWTDATNQGLVTKDNWKRMPREMLWARCLSKGANRIGQDLLLGLYSTDEMFDVLDTSSMRVKRDDDGTITEITPHEEVAA